jgi:dephospho-CoA kinase
MLIVGLTGNMGCGKSTVAQMLAKFPDTVVVDCDQLAKEVLTSPAFRATAEQILGPEVFKDGQLDNKAASALFFRDPDIKRRLQSAVFPLALRKLTRLENEARLLMVDKALFVVESAILFESGLDRRWPAKTYTTVCVTCPPDEQRRRLKANRGMTDEEIDARLQHQMSADEKVKRSAVEISSDCDLNALEQRVNGLHGFLRCIADKKVFG